MATYTIQVFNQCCLQPFPVKSLISTLQEVHFGSLCRQYGLHPGLIQPALTHLEVISPAEKAVPYFLLRYQVEEEPPLIIFQWPTDQKSGAAWLKAASRQVDDIQIQGHLAQTCEIIGVSLNEGQLDDLGLLLAYEVARWAAFKGQGLVYGLDGTWYRLNRHRAFLPVSEKPSG